MRIAIFTDTYLPEVNGVVTTIDSHARVLSSRGHELLIICPRYAEPTVHDAPGVQVKRYRSIQVTSNRATRLAVPSMASFAATLRRFAPDVVHVHTTLSLGLVGLATAKMMRLPVVETYHTYIPDFMPYLELHRLLQLDTLHDRIIDSAVFEGMSESRAFRWLAALIASGSGALERTAVQADDVKERRPEERRIDVSAGFAWQFTRWVYNRADLVTTPSMTLKKELEQHGVTVPIEPLSNGIDMSLVPPKKSYAPTRRLLHAGRLGYEKSVEVVLAAFARTLQRHADCTLDIIGDGPSKEHIKRVAARLGISSQIRMRGFIDRSVLARIYGDYDAFVTASTIETQGLVLLEAMCAGLPIVAVRALAVPELVGDHAGLLVEPGDVAGMADALDRVLSDEALRAELGAGGREAAERHALPSVVTRLEGLYERVASEHGH